MLEAAAMARLRQGVAALPFAVSEAQIEALARYLLLLNQWNAVHNLTAVREVGEQVVVHVLDCLAVLPLLPVSARRLADVGSGAGLPALILALMRPEIRVFAVESSAKKAAFIRYVASALALENVEVVAKRVENWQVDVAMDVVISRAMAGVDLLLSLSRHLAGFEGVWLLMRAREAELASVAGFDKGEVLPVAVPFLKASRHVLRVVKIVEDV